MPQSSIAPGRSTLHFLKMEALGNDFIVVLDQALESLEGLDLGQVALQLCHRQLGIGADGLVLLNTGSRSGRLRIYNQDGSKARNCGNALLCVATLLWARQRGRRRELRLEIEGGPESVATAKPTAEGIWPVVRLDPPDFLAKAVPVEPPPGVMDPVLDQEMMLGPEPLRLSCVSMGNPHCVLFPADLNEHLLMRLGPRLERAPWFPDRVNVELVRIEDRSNLRVLVWERGVGPTLACGTGAAAAAVVARKLGRVEATVGVELPGGRVEITWLGEGLPVFLSGPARQVFVGQFPVEWLRASLD